MIYLLIICLTQSRHIWQIRQGSSWSEAGSAHSQNQGILHISLRALWIATYYCLQELEGPTIDDEYCQYDKKYDRFFFQQNILRYAIYDWLLGVRQKLGPVKLWLGWHGFNSCHPLWKIHALLLMSCLMKLACLQYMTVNVCERLCFPPGN
jgi:hypothetical protein